MIFKLAIRNIVCNKRNYFPVFFCMFLVIGMTVSIFYYSDSILQSIRQKLTSDERCIIQICSKSAQLDLHKSAIDEVCRDPSVCDIYTGCQMFAPQLVPHDFYLKHPDNIPTGSFSDSYAVINGAVYSFSNFPGITKAENISMLYIDHTVMNEKNIISNGIMCGDMINDPGQIIIPEQYLKMLGISHSEYEELIGKELSIHIRSYPDSIDITLFKGLKIVGILSESYFAGNEFMSFIVPLEDLSKKTDDYVIYSNLYIDIYDYDKCNSIIDKLHGAKMNDVYLLSPYDTIDFMYKQYFFVTKVIGLIAIFIFIALMLYLVIFITFSVQRSAQMSAVYVSLGFTPKDVMIIRVLENTVTAVASFIFSLPLFCILAHFTLGYINLDGYSFSISALTKAAVLSSFVICLFTLVCSFIIRKNIDRSLNTL